MQRPKIEDSILKLASEVFARELLPFFGVKEKVIASVPTELIQLDLSRQYMDYTYLTENEIYHHFEFQSARATPADIYRFHAYESVLMMKTGKPVITHVIYSGNIKNPLSGCEYGLNSYHVHAITMNEKNAEEVLLRIEANEKKNRMLTKEECLELILIPLMGGNLSKQEKILRAICITKNIEQKEVNQMQAMLYAFAEKFLSAEERMPVKEVILMTHIGQMIIEEGIERGLEKGENLFAALAETLLREGKTEDLSKAVSDKAYRESLYKEYKIKE